VVDLFGQPADVDAITQIAHAENIKVLVDGAQSFRATAKGRGIGMIGDATTTSFFSSKTLAVLWSGVAANYSELLSDICKVPMLLSGHSSSWAQYTLKLDSRDSLESKLKDVSISSVVYYPIPLSKQVGYGHYPAVSGCVGTSELLAKKC
jgi:dTDP-4-amino-4,6-dideoxygalactose transaminase